MRQILVCVTFREFDGSTNAKMQQKFLESIAQQDYKNFKLIVTNFREQFVRQALDESKLPYEFYQSDKDCRFAWTEVVQNSFQHLEKGHNIILWTNADNVFEPNLFSEIVANLEPGSGGTSYPPIHYAGLQDFEHKCPMDTFNNKPLRAFYQMDPNYWVPEAIYIDGDLLLNPENQRLFLEYEFRDCAPGQVVTLVFAFFAGKLNNLIYRSKIHTIKNAWSEDQTVVRLAKKERITPDQTAEILKQYWDSEEVRQSLESLKSFCHARGIDKRYIPGYHPLKKLNQNRRFKPVGRSDQKLAYEAYLTYWLVRHSLGRTDFGYSFIRRSLGRVVRKFYKR